MLIAIVGYAVYLLLAIAIMILIVLRYWRNRQPTCRQILLGPSLILLLTLVLLGPVVSSVGLLVEWYTLRASGVQTTAVVVAHHIIRDWRTTYPHRLDVTYRVYGPDGGICLQVKQNEPVSSKVYDRHRIGSTIPIWYLADRPQVAHTESAEGYAWTYAARFFGFVVISGLVAYLKQFKWV